MSWWRILLSRLPQESNEKLHARAPTGMWWLSIVLILFTTSCIPYQVYTSAAALPLPPTLPCPICIHTSCSAWPWICVLQDFYELLNTWCKWKKPKVIDLLSTSRSIRQSLSGSTHSMSNVRHPSTNVMTIQGTTCGSSAEKIFVGSTWYLGGHVIIGMRLLPRVQVLIVAHLPFFRPVGFVTPLATCFHIGGAWHVTKRSSSTIFLNGSIYLPN